MCNNHKEISETMSAEETDRIITIVKEAIKHERSKEEIFETFKDAGIITKNGNLKAPYKEIYIPTEE
jgi:divalent metal cation (Fe/Co/Zn/Cd) transporter